VVNAIAHIDVKAPRLTKQRFNAGSAAAVAVEGGLLLGIRLRFHKYAPQQLAIGLAFHQQSADELGGNLLGGAGEEALAGSGAGNQRVTGTQAGGESQALRQWGAAGGRWGLRGAQWGGVAWDLASLLTSPTPSRFVVTSHIQNQLCRLVTGTGIGGGFTHNLKGAILPQITSTLEQTQSFIALSRSDGSLISPPQFCKR